MADDPGTLSAAALVRSTAIFRDLSDEQLAAVWSQAKVLSLTRGDVLVAGQLEVAEPLYIVVSGRSRSGRGGGERALNDRSVGEPIGETGFSGARERHHRGGATAVARSTVHLRPRRARGAGDLPDAAWALARAAAGSRPTSEERVGVAHDLGDRRGDAPTRRHSSTASPRSWADAAKVCC
jgi:hypothetical protein